MAPTPTTASLNECKCKLVANMVACALNSRIVQINFAEAALVYKTAGDADAARADARATLVCRSADGEVFTEGAEVTVVPAPHAATLPLPSVSVKPSPLTQ